MNVFALAARGVIVFVAEAHDADEAMDEEFQIELEGMYRETGAGEAPLAPALMAMAVLLQAYAGVSDAETVELTVVDLRWRLSLVLCKPWVARNSNPVLFTEQDCLVDMRRLTIACPAGQTERSPAGQTVEFDPDTCGRCRLCPQCSLATTSGRTVSIAEDEAAAATSKDDRNAQGSTAVATARHNRTSSRSRCERSSKAIGFHASGPTCHAATSPTWSRLHEP